MNQILSTNLQPLDKQLRKKLESAVKDARDVIESAAHAACHQLSVGAAKPDSHLSDDEMDLRRRLRIHGRQLGDVRKENKTQEVDRLVEEIGYEHWHRMLFARFLAENNLLMYPDPDQPVAITLDECDELAADEGAKNGWELAARYAAKMLPQIFRVDSPVFSLTLPTENQQKLEKILSGLPIEVFTASDSLGWVYQFWQAKRKDEVIEQVASGRKVGERELPPATQDFTEPYMVSFLLDNSLGTWWAARRLTEEDLRTADSEQELREKAALPGVPLEYLRFVRTRSGDEGEGEANAGPWTPAAGTFDAWPQTLVELKTLDPCCGSGHFLVAALLKLTPMRMELEGLSAKEAVDRVLSENLHGLEIDQRCVELAAFALALAAWRFPEAGGYRVLPDLNVACCGLSVSVAKEEWTSLADGNEQLESVLEFLHGQFANASTLGSLINPTDGLGKGSLFEVASTDLNSVLAEALQSEEDFQRYEMRVAAKGIIAASQLLGSKFHLVFTNPPYLTRGKQNDLLKNFSSRYYKLGDADIATVFFRRMKEFLFAGGSHVSVTPLNWLFLKSYSRLRKDLLINSSVKHLARIGSAAKAAASWDVLRALSIVVVQPSTKEDVITGLEAPSGDEESRSVEVVSEPVISSSVEAVFGIPDVRLMLDFEQSSLPLLSSLAETGTGVCTFDSPRFLSCFWEQHVPDADVFIGCQSTVEHTQMYDGAYQSLRWENGKGDFADMMSAKAELENYRSGIWRAWSRFIGRKGICVSLMGGLSCTLFQQRSFDNNTGVIVPQNGSDLAAIWSFCSSEEFAVSIRTIDQKLNVTTATLAKIPFDLEYWQQVSSEKYPYGLPEPCSDDPTQWVFHGHPACSTDALQVAVARLLGYRWPAELDAEMLLATDARALVERSSQLTDLADNDGIACIPAIGTEQPAEDRLLNLLHRAYEQGRAQEQVFRDKLDAADENDPVTVDLWRRGWQPSLPDSFRAWRNSLLEAADHTGKTLESWLRDKFFTQHFKLFHHRPFIWHIWDGLKDGFSVLVNYHKFDNKLLSKLIHTYLNDWIKKQKNSSEDGREERLAAAKSLKTKLEKILKGESPHDIFIRWKPLEEQPIGWNPDLNDGVRLNIRPWMTVADTKKKGEGILRDKPNCKWTKDRGKDVKSAPWYHLGPQYGEEVAARINDHHLSLAEKKVARIEALSNE